MAKRSGRSSAAGGTAPVLAGRVTDGGSLTQIYVTGESPSGLQFTSPVTPTSGGDWHYALESYGLGSYTLWVQAEDAAGNAGTAGPYSVTVTLAEVRSVYLPVVLRDYTYQPEVDAPDLALDRMTLAPLTLHVTNTGTLSVAHAFRVDVYVDAEVEPGVGQTWESVAPQGGYWLVTSDVPLAPGTGITLTVGDAYYQAGGSNLPADLSSARTLYVVVDTLDEIAEPREDNNRTGGEIPRL